MSDRLAPVVYHYEVDGHDIEIRRLHVGTAYARNGNVHNPTKYFAWEVSVDGEHVAGHLQTRRSAYEHGRAHIKGIDYYDHPNYPTRWRGVRQFRVVDAEMAANRAKSST